MRKQNIIMFDDFDLQAQSDEFAAEYEQYLQYLDDLAAEERNELMEA